MRRFSCHALLALVLFVSSHSLAGERLSKLDILNKGYPRAFFFRSTEGMSRRGKVPFEEWDAIFSRLNGIMGKCLDEEVPRTMPNCMNYFTKFKSMHPNQVVLLHYNGNARDPRFQCEEFFAGHWVYTTGCGLTKDLPAEEGESIVHVEDPKFFKVNMGRYGDKNMDIGICQVGPDGKRNWHISEQVQLLDVDPKAKTIKVKRGAFGTKPIAFKAGETCVAPHVTEGPWGRRSNLLWYHNYSTTCPKDAKGRTCSDVLVEDLAKRFGPGGELEKFDGLEFDVLNFGHMKAPANPYGPDMNADGVADWGIVDGVNVYGVGVYEFCRKLRERMGNDIIIQADGASPRSQRSFGLLNGIESEGWPALSDHKADDWSGGLNRHIYWRDHARKPVFNYVNHKYIERVPDGKKGQNRQVKTPFSLTRLVLAACMFTDSMVTYSLRCPSEPGERFGIYDELRKGTEHEINWLGMPVGPPIRLALKAPDLLKGCGVKPTEAFLKQWSSQDEATKISLADNAVRIAGGDTETRTMRWKMRGQKNLRGDLFVHFRIQADPMAGYPSAIPRLLWVEARSESQVMGQQAERTGMILRGKEETEIDRETRASVRPLGKTGINGDERYGYFVHPPWYGGVAGAVFWEADVVVPKKDATLRFATGLRPAPSKSDGIVYKVVVRDGDKSKEVFSHHHTEFAWKEHRVDLSPWQGKRVTLRFLADCGPKDNCTADHGCWAEVRFGDAEAAREKFKPKRYMGFAGKDGDDVGFYFRDMDCDAAELRFTIEGTEPVRISNLTIHAHTDAIVREFEKGVVIANPSDHEYTFDLRGLFPAKKLRRIKGSSRQDPTANNGKPVGDKITLSPRDALFLAAAD
ncbi:MAG: hypothetical protein GXP25_00555 [Planctomycetes bacterium]|nr:hypothetical protein [Planctomycetota bacterium]